MSARSGDSRDYYAPAPERYALSGKIMLSAIVILFTVVLLIICLHIYARWYLTRSRRRQQQNHLRNRRRRAHLIFTSDIPNTTTVLSQGLDASLLKSLPTFIYSSNTHNDVLECAVCLSEFEENENGRLLPKCNHTFHIGCIDMWFHSHSTCPLCRAPVTAENTELPVEIVVNSADLEPGTSSGLCSSCEHEKEQMSSSSSTTSSNSNTNSIEKMGSVGLRRKEFELVGVSIEVPRRNESFKNFEEVINGSPGGQVFKSPGGRILSFKRILNRDRRPSTPLNYSSSAIEIDLEKGEIDEEQIQTPPPSNHQSSLS